jgi:hypothetical protein
MWAAGVRHINPSVCTGWWHLVSPLESTLLRCYLVG